MKGLRALLAPLAAAGLAAGLTACGDVPVEQQVTIERPAATVFTYLATAPAGAPFGTGATLTVTEASANAVKGDLTVGEKSTPVEFAVAPGAGGSTLTVRAKKSRFGGAELEPTLTAGLEALKAETLALGAFDFGDLKFEVTELPARDFVFVADVQTPLDAASIKSGVLQAMTIVDAQIRAMGLVPDGPPIAVETMWDEAANTYMFNAGRPYRGTLPTVRVGVRVGKTPGGVAIRVPYEGAEESVIPVYDQIETLIAAGRLEKVGGSFEVYLDDPTQVGGSVKREIYHIVSGDAQRLMTLFPNSRPAAIDSTAPSVVGTVAGAPAPAAPAEAQPAAGAPAAEAAPAPSAPLTPATP